MTPQLWLLRHGEAVPHGSVPDEDRQLTPRGRRQAETAGAALAALGERFAACYSSPKLRALQTARLACERFGVEPVVEHALGDGFSRVDALALLAAHGSEAKVLVVGHEPSLSQVVYDFAAGRVDFKKGGLAAVLASRSAGSLLVLARPKDLEALVEARRR